MKRAGVPRSDAMKLVGHKTERGSDGASLVQREALVPMSWMTTRSRQPAEGMDDKFGGGVRT
jgi:hypothetical protein